MKKVSYGADVLWKVSENAKDLIYKKNHEKYIYAFGNLADRQRDKWFME